MGRKSLAGARLHVKEEDERNVAPPKGNFQGYEKNRLGLLTPDDELTRVGPGTPCGELLRRFWMPIAMTSQLADLPLRVRRLGEDLVLFRDRAGRYGLLHLNCSHRNASLEFGIVEDKGLRCCYHGWLYGVDGTVVETPGEPSESPIRQRVRHGAYPVIEFKGLIFAYMGPPAEQPEFPIFDTYDITGDEMVPFLIPSPCNWLQIAENSTDPIHVPFLHARVSGIQFQDNFEHIGVIAYHKRPNGVFYTTARRCGEMAWVRVHDHLTPNFSQNGGMWTEGTAPVYFARCGLTRWVVPVDDENAITIAWRHFNEETDPKGRGRKELCGYNSVDFYGQTDQRSYAERQCQPGDYDAWVGQGPITVHARENLGHADTGVGAYRSRLRRAIRKLAQGEPPFQPSQLGNPVPTYSGDTVLRIPKSNVDDGRLLSAVSQRVATILQSGDFYAGEERREFIRRQLRNLESEGVALP